jgi:hypothetical protein
MTRNGFSRSSHKWMNLLPEKFAFLMVTRVYLLTLGATRNSALQELFGMTLQSTMSIRR